MRFLVKIASFVFHPLWIPFLGTLFYFAVTPRFFPATLVQAKLLAISITTLFIPVVFYLLLKNLGKATSIFMDDVKERKWPLLFYLLLIILNLHQVLNEYNYPALYYFFVGIFFSALISFLCSWFRLKISLHMVGLGGLFMFVVALSIFYRLDLIYTIAFLVMALGLTASSRLYYKAHSITELILGLLTGILPQVIATKLWL